MVMRKMTMTRLTGLVIGRRVPVKNLMRLREGAMEVGFDDKLNDLRIDLHDIYIGLQGNLQEESVPAILRGLLNQRNAFGEPVPGYFDFDFLKPLDVATAVLEGALSEVDWLAKVDKPEDIENRIHWVHERQGAFLEGEKNLEKDRKLATLKGRFIVLYTSLLRLGMYNQGD